MTHNIWVFHKSKKIFVTDDIGGVPVEVCITPDNPQPGYYAGQFDDWQACQDKAMELSEKHDYPVEFSSTYYDTGYWKHWRTPDMMYESRELIGKSPEKDSDKWYCPICGHECEMTGVDDGIYIVCAGCGWEDDF